MHTRQDYLQGKVSHEDYYAQFVTDSIKQLVAKRIGVGRIRASKDEHFNDIPLLQWDALYGYSERDHQSGVSSCGLGSALREAGEQLCASTICCVMKAAARQIKRGD